MMMAKCLVFCSIVECWMAVLVCLQLYQCVSEFFLAFSCIKCSKQEQRFFGEILMQDVAMFYLFAATRASTIASGEASMVHTHVPSFRWYQTDTSNRRQCCYNEVFEKFSDSGPAESANDEPDVSVVDPLVQKAIYPSVSITPVTTLQSSYPNISLERRPGIEIIAFNKESSAGIPSSLTITAVPFSEKDYERKERKRRREDEEKTANNAGGVGVKPTKMMMAALGSALMAPPAVSKQEQGANSRAGLVVSPSATSPSKHPTSGGKPSLSALKCKSSIHWSSICNWATDLNSTTHYFIIVQSIID